RCRRAGRRAAAPDRRGPGGDRAATRTRQPARPCPAPSTPAGSGRQRQYPPPAPWRHFLLWRATRSVNLGAGIDNRDDRPLTMQPPRLPLAWMRRYEERCMRGKDKVMALDVGAPATLEPDMQAYFAKCVEKLGFVPNVLQAYAFDNAKLRAFILMADDLMLADSGLSKLEREMIA